MLDSHRDIAAPAETKLAFRLTHQMRHTLRVVGPNLQREHGLGPDVVAVAYGSVLRVVLEQVRRKAGTKWVADKTPSNVLGFPDLQHMLPDSPLVHVLRDGRDVVASLLQESWKDIATGEPLLITSDPRAAAAHWVRCVLAGRSVSRVLEIRYEDLVADPEPALMRLVDAIGVPFDPRMLAHHTFAHARPGSEDSRGDVVTPVHARSVGRWRERLDRPARLIVAEVAGPLLRELGYAADDTWVDA
jgi:protein-tyrosine sulfotransferase